MRRIWITPIGTPSRSNGVERTVRLPYWICLRTSGNSVWRGEKIRDMDHLPVNNRSSRRRPTAKPLSNFPSGPHSLGRTSPPVSNYRRVLGE